MELTRLTALIIVVFAVGYALLVRVKTRTSIGESIVSDKVSEEYDYVVVGGGSAGSVLASRLSEDKNYSVLLLEAGDHFDYDENVHIPVLAFQFLKTKLAWHYQSEKENGMFLGLNENTSLLNRGRVLGGSSTINACVYARGSPFDFEQWEKKYKCKGWGYNDILPYFKKAEDIQIPNLKASDYHGRGGPIAVSASPHSRLSDYFIDAGKELGYMETDYNGKMQTGFSRAQNTVRNGVRSSTGLEYLGKIGKRKNLDISINSFVTKIQTSAKVATGVDFIKNGRKQFVKARRDVIVSAGAFNSPQLLMLSGIGPKSHLHDLDIPLVQDLPVGQKLDDQINFAISVKINQSIHLDKEKAKGIWTLLEYKLFGKGPLSSLVYSVALLHIDKAKMGKERPDIMMILLPTTFDDVTMLNYNDASEEELVKPYINIPGFTLMASLLHPRGTGSVRLRSSDPFDNPILDTNHLSDKQDEDDLLAGIRILEEILSTKAMKSIGADISTNKASFCSHHKFRSDDFWRCMIHHIAHNFYHSTSTCKMGMKGDSTAVVDLDLRVQGIKNLRVCDASVIPSVTSGNTNAPVIAVAEKFADMLKKERH